MFHQFEGVCIDKGINLTHLKGTIEYFVHSFFGKDRKVRFRPHHFRFTEPSFELDISCDICGGTSEVGGEKCKVCKSGWLELGGAGMIHPNVLTAGGVDPETYSGWALGFGIERNFMMKQGLKLDDIRTLYSNDIRFLEQF
jgi:phenylalanyl-tRNA synthetase alpha chain